MARGTALTCFNLSDEDLRYCFSRIFELDSECRFFSLFRDTYKAARKAMENGSSAAAGS